MEPIVLYYTLMGETKNAAMAIATGLGTEAVAVYSLKPSDIERLKKCDIVVFGCGSYFGMPPERALEFVDLLPRGEGRKAAVFCVGWIIIGGALDALAKRLADRGYTVVAKRSKKRFFSPVSREDKGLIGFGRKLREGV